MRLLIKVIIFLLIATPCFAVNYCEDANAVACWLFSEGSGTTVADSSSNSNTATFGAGDTAPSWAAMAGTNAPSYASHMVTCDGSNDIMTVDNDASITFGTGDWTLVIWAIGVDGNTHPAPISKGYVGSGEWALRSSFNDNADFYGDEGIVDLSNSDDYTDGSWQHTAIVIDGGNTGKMYREGVLKDTDSDIASADFDATDPLRFCNAGTSSRWWTGSVSEAALFNRVLSGAEILDIYNNGLGATSTNLAKPILGTVVIE